MSEYILAAKDRTVMGRKTNVIRSEGQVPAVVYGAGLTPKNISLDRNAFIKAYESAGESSLIELKIDNQDALHVLIHELQQDPIADEVTHVDFRMVDMTKPIEAYVEFIFTGESPAVKGLGGTLVHSLDGVDIRCLPGKLLRNIFVDLTKIMTFEDVIRVSDLDIPEGIEVLEDANASIAVVTAPRSDAEMAALNDAVQENVEAVAVEKEKKEGEAADAKAPDAKASGAKS